MADKTMLEGIPTTTPERTLVDLGRVLPEPEAGKASGFLREGEQGSGQLVLDHRAIDDQVALDDRARGLGEREGARDQPQEG